MNAILVDVTKCTGCEVCVAACVEANHIDPQAAAVDRTVARDGLSANLLCSLRQVEGRSVRTACMHCLEPSCAAACPVGALTKSPLGPVEYDEDACIGCRYCMLACPFHVPRYEWDSTFPLLRKCTMCADRLRDGKRPACVDACPHEALLFGDRDELLLRARTLVGRKPDRYLPRVWGESTWGGTCVLYVSDVNLDGAGWPQGAPAPIPALTEPLISKTPLIGVTVGFGLWAVMAIIARRRKLMSGAHDAGETESREGDGD